MDAGEPITDQLIIINKRLHREIAGWATVRLCLASSFYLFTLAPRLPFCPGGPGIPGGPCCPGGPRLPTTSSLIAGGTKVESVDTFKGEDVLVKMRRHCSYVATGVAHQQADGF